MTDVEFFKTVKQGNLSNLYFLYGTESYFVKKARDLIISLTVSAGARDFNLITFDFEKGEKADFNALVDAIESFPMPVMSPGFLGEQKKCVIVKNCDYDKLLKADFEKMLSIIADMEQNDTTVLVLCQTNATVDMKKSAKYKKLAEEVSRLGIACEFPQKDKLTLKRALCEKARKENVNMDMDVADALIARTSQSYSVLENEMQKLIAYARETNGEITLQFVDLCTIPSIEASAFDLAKLILKNQYEAAFLKLSDLFFLRQEAVAVLSALSMAFSDIYRAFCANQAGKKPDDVTLDFAYSKNRLFAVRNAFSDVRSFKPNQIHACIRALFEADLQLKSSKLNDRLILEQMLFKMQIAWVT